MGIARDFLFATGTQSVAEKEFAGLPVGYKKAGVLFTGLVPAHQIQMNLVDTRDRERAQKLMTTIDHINTQMGTGAIQYAVAGFKPNWQMRRSRMSLRYTTRWDELVVVRAV
jgi:DNA polymerase V